METDILDKIEEEINEELSKRLIIHNDEVNSFENVINALIDICKHTLDQAEQCTMIIHHKGKCSVKEGDEEMLNNMRRDFVGIGIGATVE